MHAGENEPEASPLLDVDGIHSFYGKSHILQGVSLWVGRGEVVALLGRNGVGKSTTLKTIMGLVQPSQGRISFEGPSKLIRPWLGCTSPMIVLRVVLLPTPLRPSSATTSPRPTHSETPCRIWLLP